MPEELATAIYYPYIHVRDAAWLKMAVLYWDVITRIVPDDFDTHDGDDTLPAIDAGLVTRTPPDAYLEATAKKFRREYLARKATKRTESIWRTIDRVPAGDIVDIHPGKVQRRLLEDMVRMRLATVGRDRDLDVNRDVGVAYMFCLANEMGRAMQMPIVTHEPAAADATPAFQFRISRFPAARTTRIPTVVKLQLPFPTAEAVADIPWKKILSFRRREANLRIAFRSHLEEVAKSIPSTADPNLIKAKIHEQKQRLAAIVEKNSRAWDRLGVKTAVSALQLSVPVSVKTAASAAAVDPISAKILAGTAIVMVGIGLWATFGSEREKVTDSNPLQYLVDVNRLAGQPL